MKNILCQNGIKHPINKLGSLSFFFFKKNTKDLLKSCIYDCLIIHFSEA